MRLSSAVIGTVNMSIFSKIWFVFVEVEIWNITNYNHIDYIHSNFFRISMDYYIVELRYMTIAHPSLLSIFLGKAPLELSSQYCHLDGIGLKMAKLSTFCSVN